MSGIDFILESLRLSLIRFRHNDDEAELFVEGNSCMVLSSNHILLKYHTDIEL